MSKSYLSSEVLKIGEGLKGSTQTRVSDYRKRFDVTKEMYDEFLNDLIVQGFNSKKSLEFVKRFFGSSDVSFAAIDGTVYKNEIFDLIIFFGGAFSSMGKITFNESGTRIRYSDRVVEEGHSISSCVPLYINEVPDIDQTFFEEREEEIALGKNLRDEEIIDNSNIANTIMHFAEYFLAYSLLKENKDLKILLMDRTLSGDQASLVGKTSRRMNWARKASLTGYKVEGEEITTKLLEYGRYRIHNKKLDLPPSRGDYLRYGLIYFIEGKGRVNLEEILEEMNVNDRKDRVVRLLRSLKKDGFIKESKGVYEVTDDLKNTWTILKKLVLEIGKLVFEENKLEILKDGKRHYLTTLDLNFMTLFCFYMLLEECWKNNVLLIGLTKDTSARDFKRHFIPLCQNNRILETEIDQNRLGLIPNTDRMFLQTVSLFSVERVSPPWSLVEYDSSFKTLVPERKVGYVRGAIRNKISPERFFLKSYIQLVAAESDSRLRSNVLAMDRLVYEEDIKDDNVFIFKNKYGKFDEPVNVIIYKDKNVVNEVQNVTMQIMSSMTESNIPELFGHNKPLFIADKVAKWHVGLIRNVMIAMRRWILNNPELRDFIFYMTTFRQRRGEIERHRGG